MEQSDMLKYSFGSKHHEPCGFKEALGSGPAVSVITSWVWPGASCLASLSRIGLTHTMRGP